MDEVDEVYDDVEEEEDIGSQGAEIIKEQETEKKEQAIYDIEQIKLNSDNILRVIEIQLTKVLKDVTEIEDQLDQEVNQYWLKELPIQNLIKSYLRQVGSLINLYHQQENLYEKTIEEIMTGVEFPDFVKIEETYIDKINELKDKMDIMKNEFMKNREDLKEQFEQEKEIVKKEAVAKTHDEYEEKLTKLELEFEGKNAMIKKLKKREPQIVDEKETDEKSTEFPRAVYSKPIEAPSSKIEFIEPKTSKKRHPAVEEFFKKSGFKKTDGVIVIPNRKVFRKEFLKLLLTLMFDEYTYKDIKTMLSKEFSVSTFYKYLNELIDEGRIIKEGRYPDEVILKYITPTEGEKEKENGKED